MPLALFKIEQLEGNRWHCEAEAGGFAGQRNFKAEGINATSFEGVIAAVSEFYYRQVPPAVVVDSSVTPDVSGRDQPPPETPPEVTDEPKMADERDYLRLQAVALGIDVDNRWAVKRLHTEIAKAKAAKVDGETVVE